MSDTYTANDDGSYSVVSEDELSFIELLFNNSILSIRTNLFFLLNEDLFRFIINSLI